MCVVCICVCVCVCVCVGVFSKWLLSTIGLCNKRHITRNKTQDHHLV